MDPRLEKKVNDFRQWLINQDIDFVEKANGHFQIFNVNQELVYQVWATTERIIDNPSDATARKQWIGLAKIKQILGASMITTPNPEEPISDLRKAFRKTYNENNGFMNDCILVIAVHLPTGATEIITNHYEVQSKMKYYLTAYDEQFKLKTNPKVQVTGFMLV